MSTVVYQAEERLLKAALRSLMAERSLADPDGNLQSLGGASDALRLAAMDLADAVQTLPLDKQPRRVEPGRVKKVDARCGGPRWPGSPLHRGEPLANVVYLDRAAKVLPLRPVSKRRARQNRRRAVMADRLWPDRGTALSCALSPTAGNGPTTSMNRFPGPSRQHRRPGKLTSRLQATS